MISGTIISLSSEDSTIMTELDDHTPHAFGDITIFTTLINDVDVRDQSEGGQITLNPKQPRHQDHWKSPSLVKQIVEARGLFTPPVVMPTGETTERGDPVYEMVDGHRRITALREILKTNALRLQNGTLSQEEYDQQYQLFSKVTVECTWRRLEQDELIKVWLLIHRERKEWTLQEREETAKQLVELVGVSKAAQFLGVSEAVAQKLAETYELAQEIRLPGGHQDALGKDPRMTWARELRNLRADVRDDSEVMQAVIARINAGQIKNSKDIRVLRTLGPDARDAVLDTSQDLVRDVAEPRGVKDPVRATRRGLYSEDLPTKLQVMATQINAVELAQLSAVRGDRMKRKQARESIQAMIGKLQELEELFS